MVNVILKDNKFLFDIKGLHQIWALKSSFTVDKTAVTTAYQDHDELNKFSGLRLGTYIPFLITAGTYFLKGKRNFWDMSRKKNTIIVLLQNHAFHKLYIEVDNPEQTINLLNSK